MKKETSTSSSVEPGYPSENEETVTNDKKEPPTPTSITANAKTKNFQNIEEKQRLMSSKKLKKSRGMNSRSGYKRESLKNLRDEMKTFVANSREDLNNIIVDVPTPVMMESKKMQKDFNSVTNKEISFSVSNDNHSLTDFWSANSFSLNESAPDFRPPLKPIGTTLPSSRGRLSFSSQDSRFSSSVISYSSFRRMSVKPRVGFDDKKRKRGKINPQIKLKVGKFRYKLGKIINSTIAQRVIIALILANAIILGIGTFQVVKSDEFLSNTLDVIDNVFLGLFSIEFLMQLTFEGAGFIKDPWLVFDAIILVVSFMGTGWFFEGKNMRFSVFRAFRVLRVFLLLKRIEILRVLVNAVIRVLPRLYAIMGLLVFIIYIYSVLFTQLFKELDERNFGSLFVSFFTCVNFMTLEWASEGRTLFKHPEGGWPYAAILISFLFCAHYMAFSLLIAVICDAVSTGDELDGKIEGKKELREKIEKTRIQLNKIIKKVKIIIKQQSVHAEFLSKLVEIVNLEIESFGGEVVFHSNYKGESSMPSFISTNMDISGQPSLKQAEVVNEGISRSDSSSLHSTQSKLSYSDLSNKSKDKLFTETYPHPSYNGFGAMEDLSSQELSEPSTFSGEARHFSPLDNSHNSKEETEDFLQTPDRQNTALSSGDNNDHTRSIFSSHSSSYYAGVAGYQVQINGSESNEGNTKNLSLIKKCRNDCGAIVNHPYAQILIAVLLIANAVLLGFSTFVKQGKDAQMDNRIFTIDLMFVIAFTVEISMQLAYCGFAFFKDGFFVFDFIVIASSWVGIMLDSNFQFSALRTVRLVRIVRLVTYLKPLRDLITAIVEVMPLMNYLLGFLLLVFYMFAVLFTELYRKLELEEKYFTSLNASLFTCFEMLTMEWAHIARNVKEQKGSRLPIVMFLITSRFVFMSLLIAVMNDAVAVIGGVAAKQRQELRDELSQLKKRVNDLTTSVREVTDRHISFQYMMQVPIASYFDLSSRLLYENNILNYAEYVKAKDNVELKSKDENKRSSKKLGRRSASKAWGSLFKISSQSGTFKGRRSFSRNNTSKDGLGSSSHRLGLSSFFSTGKSSGCVSSNGSNAYHGDGDDDNCDEYLQKPLPASSRRSSGLAYNRSSSKGSAFTLSKIVE